MRKLHTEHVLILYALVAKATSGGTRGLRNIDALKSVVEVQNLKDDKLKSKNYLYKTAARMMKKMIEERPFKDGNKRAAMLAGLTLIKLNGRDLQARKGDIEDYAVCLANDQPSIGEVASWLKRHSNPAD